MNVNAVRAQVEKIMRQFPSETATICREQRNAYNEETGTQATIATAEIWWTHQQPKQVKADEKGLILEEDGRKWACAVWREELDAVQAGDIMLCNGHAWRIRNVDTRMKVRVFFQLEEA